MLYRSVYKTLKAWKNSSSHNGLLVTGARQVGKTTAIENFARENYKNFIKIDFVEQPNAIETITQATDIEDLIIRISSMSSTPLNKGTLLFFDEVQLCGDSITWMRYLSKEERFDVIFSGSMLGISAYNFRSLPVGTIDFLEMFPLTFFEFTKAMGFDEKLWEIIYDCFLNKKQVPDFLHNQLIDLINKYCLVGGMPEAVDIFANQNDTFAMRQRQISIVDAYEADVSQYINDKSVAQTIKTIFRNVPSGLNKENKRFLVSGIDKKKRFTNMQSKFDWLVNSGTVLMVKRVLHPEFPLGIDVDNSFFKLYMNDVGLLFSNFSQTNVSLILNNSNEINFGQIYENFVAEELRACGDENIFYFRNREVGEIDFVIGKKNSPEVLPIEVKSGIYSKKHKSLDKLMAIKNYHIKHGIVLHKRNLEEDGKVLYLPLYMTSFLIEQE